MREFSASLFFFRQENGILRGRILSKEKVTQLFQERISKLHDFLANHELDAVKRIHLDALARKLQWKRSLLDGMLAIFL
ncbi:hypothetical protein EN829_049970, partial [Mesorhizobium sp. M00.F.Ca.ET.186.01.1.1]